MALGAIIGGVAGAVGNYFAQKSAQKQANKNQRRAEAHELNILQNQTQWRVQDAMKAGLHPLAALGMNPAQSSLGAGQVFGNNTDYASMGADLGRAVESMAKPEEKIVSQALQLSFEKQKLENEYVKTQVASQRMRNAQQAAPGKIGMDPALNGSLKPEDGVRIPFTDYTVPFADKGIAQKVEDSWGELGGELYGFGSQLESYYRYMNVEKYLTGDNYTPTMIKSAPGQGGNPDFSNAMGF